MQCSDDLVQLYIDGTLHAAEAAVVEAHLETCPSCRRRAATFKALCWDLSRTVQPTPASSLDPDALAERLLAEHRRLQASHAPGRGALGLALLWLTANPAVVRPLRTVGSLGHAGAGGLLRAGHRALRRLLRREGGG